MGKKFIVLFVILVLVTAGVGFFLFVTQKTDTTLPNEHLRVRLSWVHQAQFAGMYVAKEKGFYKDAHLDVELLAADANTPQTAELTRGDVEASIMEAHQLLADSANLNTLQAVAAIYQINPHSLAARQDSGIKSPKDFSGKTVGLAGGKSEGSALFEIFIKDVGHATEVTYKELGFDTVEDFIQHRADVIDVYRIDQPYLAEKKGVPLTVIPLEAYGFSTYGDVLAMSKDFINKHPETVRRFVQATLKGWDYALNHPTEAIDTTLRYATGDYADRAYEEHILFESIPLIRGNAPSLGMMELVPWSILYESMRRVGVINTDFNVEDIYTNDFVR